MALRRCILLACVALTPVGRAVGQSAAWPLHGHDLGGQRYSPLASIDTATVARLAPRWTYHSGVTATFQATPIVVGGVMYVSLPMSGVVALDAATGHERWRYTHKSRTDKLCCGPANRGVAVSGGRVYVGTVDGRLVALDARTGAVAWDVTVAEYQGTTEAVSQLGADDPLSRVERKRLDRRRDQRRAARVRRQGVRRDRRRRLRAASRSGTRRGRRDGAVRPARPDGGVRRADRPARVALRTSPGPGWEGEFRTATPDGVPLPRDVAAERATRPRARRRLALRRRLHLRYAGGGCRAGIC